jgi:hypothetical protein
MRLTPEGQVWLDKRPVKTVSNLVRSSERGRSYINGDKRMPKVKGKSMFNSIRPVGTGSSFSSHTTKNSIPKYLYDHLKQSKSDTLLEDRAFRVKSEYGQQGVGYYSVNTGTALTVLMDKTEPGTSMSTSERMVLLNTNVKLTITNNQPTNTIVQIYELYQRRDAGPTGEREFNPVILWKDGVEGKNAISYTNLGSTPFLSSVFCEYYLVVKVYTLELGSGRTHVHNSRYNYNKPVENTLIRQSIAGVTGFTRSLLIIGKGTPVEQEGKPDDILT